MLSNKKKNIKNNFTLLEVIVITLAFSSLTGIIVGLSVYLKNNRNLILDNELLDIVDTYNKIKSNFYGEVDGSVLAESAIDGMMKTLNEEYSIYLDQDETNSLIDKLSGEYHGVGITVKKQNGIITVEKIQENTPADKSDLMVGDRLIGVDDYEVQEDDDLDYVSSLIKKNDKVTLKVLRDKEVLDIKIDVTTIDYPVVEHKIIDANDKKIGYIYISTFSKTAGKQFEKSLSTLEKNKINSLIIDVRSNTGGYLSTADEILNMFMKKGTILYSTDNNKRVKKVYDTTSEKRNYDIVVLIDGISASASEIVASSLKENYGAILVGTTTYGKGLVQETTSLSNSSMIKYTSARWYTPNGNYVNGIGYEPDVKVLLTMEYAKNPIDENDTQLQTAIDILSK